MSSNGKQIKATEVSKHNKRTDLWIIVHGKVYNVTKYIEEHPGGVDTLVEVAGADATATFEDVGHSEDARETMEKYLVGDLEGAGDEDDAAPKRQPHPVYRNPAAAGDGKSNSISPGFIVGGAVVSAGLLLAGSQWHLFADHGSFWHGAAVCGSLSSAAFVSLGLKVNRDLKIGQDFTSFAAHKQSGHAVAQQNPVNRGFLKPQEYQKLPLIEKKPLSADSNLYVFGLPSGDQIIGLPIGQHVAIRGNVGDEVVARSYTPVSNNTDKGVIKLVIKSYGDGKLTGGYLDKLQVGDLVDFRGPKGAMRYRKNTMRELGLIAGGTGITPMYQLIRAICEDPTDKTKVSLLFGNNTEEDILLRAKLEEFARKYPNKFNMTHVLSKPAASWKGARGFVTKEMIAKQLPQAGQDVQICLCGPPPMVNASKKALVELGFDKPRAVSKMTDQVFCF